MKFLIPIIFILFFLSCSKGEKNNFDKNIKYAVDYGIDPATHDTIYMLAIPNGFSPNGDGNNDVFYAKGFGIIHGTFTMNIYSRNGNKIFYSENMNLGWDGKANGNANVCQMGLYTVDISLADALGNPHRYLNYVQMFR